MRRAVKRIHEWLGRISKSELPSDEILAYYVGIFEVENGYTLHFVGSNTYDALDSDWACEESFIPSERYLSVPEFKGMDWEEVRSSIVDAVRLFLSEPVGKASFISNAQAVAVGFDSGDLVIVS